MSTCRPRPRGSGRRSPRPAESPTTAVGEEVDVRAATEADLGAVIDVLTASFLDDPMLGWSFPDRRSRRRRLEALWRFIAGGVYLPGGASTVGVENGEIVAAALWRRPDDLARSEEFFAEHGEAFYVALEGDLDRLAIVTAAMSAHHPTAPHWYLLAAGVVPPLQGGGRGGRLIGRTLDALDAGDRPAGDRHTGDAYLEATSPRSRVLYRRLGFTDLDTVDVGAAESDTVDLDEAPTLWTMWRPDRSAKPAPESADS